MTEPIETLMRRQNWVNDHNGPLYLQLRRHIENAIRSGRIKPGAPLPSERRIAAIGDVSRVTVRKAVQDLVRDGLVCRRPGSGTSVAVQVERVEQSLSQLTSFSQDMARRGRKVRSIWLEKGLFTPAPPEIMALGLGADAMVSRVCRLRLADDVPLAIERASLLPQILPEPHKVGQSLYAFLDRLGSKPVRAIQRISAGNLGAADAELLDVPQGAAGLNIERISYLTSGHVVEFTRSVYRGDAYDFVAELRLGTETPERQS